MTLWFNDPKANETYARIGGSLEKENNELIWKEARIKETSDSVWVYGILNDADDIKKYGDNNFKIDDHKVCIQFRTQNWTAKGETKQPTKLDLFFAKYLKEHWEGKTFKGKLTLLDNESALTILETGEKKGKKVSQDYLNDLIEQFVDLEEIESSEVKENDFNPISSSGGGSRYSRSQSEGDKLADKFSFLNSQLGEYSDKDDLLVTAMALKTLKKDDPELFETLQWLLNLLFAS